MVGSPKMSTSVGYLLNFHPCELYGTTVKEMETNNVLLHLGVLLRYIKRNRNDLLSMEAFVGSMYPSNGDGLLDHRT